MKKYREEKQVKKIAIKLAINFLMHKYLENLVFSLMSIGFAGSSAVMKCWSQVSTYAATFFCTSSTSCGAILSRNQA